MGTVTAIETSPEYIVENILGISITSDLTTYDYFLVKWKSFPLEYCTWEPETSFIDTDHFNTLVFKFYKRHPKVLNYIELLSQSGASRIVILDIPDNNSFYQFPSRM